MKRSWAICVPSILLAGCGLHVPEVQEWYDTADNQRFTQNTLINNIKCELHRGVDQALYRYRTTMHYGLGPDWVRTWIATVTLTIQVDEKSSINPGLTFVRAFAAPKTFTLGAGLGASADAAREETISFKYKLDSLHAAGPIKGLCEDPNEILTMGDLKIGQFIDKTVFLTTVQGTINGPLSAFNYKSTFIVAYTGSATPTWKLIDITANPNSPFVNATRTKTHTITVTFAPPGNEAQKQADAIHNANLIGDAVARALKNTAN